MFIVIRWVWQLFRLIRIEVHFLAFPILVFLILFRDAIVDLELLNQSLVLGVNLHRHVVPCVFECAIRYLGVVFA